jgi:antitoxin (DNA-binding transcriptional repressor) of toxin-antitoxin stability system
MPTVNIHEARTHLSKLIDRASNGESFIIARSGRPVATLSAIGAPKPSKRLGFLAGEIAVPKGFDRMGSERVVRPRPRRAR